MAELIITLAGLGLAAPGVIDVFIRTGKYVVSKLHEDKKTKAYASDLKMFFETSYVERLELHMRQARSLLKDPTVDDVDKVCLLDNFEDIKSTMRAMHDSISHILTPGDMFNLKRRPARAELRTQTARCKERLGDFRDRVMALRDLSATDSDLFLKDHDFQWVVSDTPPITLNPVAFIRKGRVSRETKGVQPEVRHFLYETRPYSSISRDSAKENITILSQKLDAAQKADPGILPILGFRDDAQKREFQLLFAMPRVEDTAKTLAEYMQWLPDMPSLNYRVELCVQLAEAILHVHGVRLVHKSIRPDNIIVFLSSEDRALMGDREASRFKLFLLGWQYARTIDAFSTERAGEKLWQRRIYQHPQRQMIEAEADYNIGHDIYSLGACMLEILRWKPLVIHTQHVDLSFDYKQMFQSLYPGGNGTVRPPQMMDIHWMMQDPYQVRQVLLSLGKKELPRLVGKRLTDLVCDCLTLLDNEPGQNSMFISENQRETGCDFVDQILKVIHDISDAL